MNTDWKALCTELAETLAEEYGVQREFDSGDPLLGSGAIELLSRARIALSQPEPEGLTDEELDYLWTEIDGGPDCCAWRPYARAVLARWGRPATTTETP